MTCAQKRKLRARLFEKQRRRCFYCGIHLALTHDMPGEYATLDHIKPRSLGGSNKQDNFVLACEPCNRTKGNTFGYAVVELFMFRF